MYGLPVGILLLMGAILHIIKSHQRIARYWQLCIMIFNRVAGG